jgi:hypothetical protein
VSNSGTAVFSSTSSVVALYPDGVRGAMAAAWVDEAILRVRLLALPARAVLVLQLVREASVAVEASADEADLAATVAAASAVIEASVVAASEEVDEVEATEDMAKVVAASATNPTATALQTALHLVLAAASVAAAVEEASIGAAVVATETTDEAEAIEDMAAAVTVVQAAPTMSPWVTVIEPATAAIATVGMAVAETTTAHGSVGTRATAATTIPDNDEGTKLYQQLGALIWVCQKGYLPFSALSV